MLGCDKLLTTTRSAMKSSFVFGTVAALVCFAPGALARTPAAVEQIAKAVSVEMLTGAGSGVIIHRQGDLYTVITNRHVVCRNKGLCSEQALYPSFKLKTPDSKVYQVSKSAIKLLKDGAGQPLDLAIVQFRSSKSYPVAQVATPGSLKVEDPVYTAGFPTNVGWLFGSGAAKAVVNQRLADDKGGYTVIYDADTLPGMSGGGAFDQNGRLVAVHGQGDRFTENTQAEVSRSNTARAEVNSKIGINRGIPVRWVVQSLDRQGILLGDRQPPSQTGANNRVIAKTADEFFIAGFNKFVDPGENFQAGRKEAVAQFNQAVAINPRYTIAYFMRAYVRSQLKDSQGALADFNQAISLDPKYVDAYNGRGNLKQRQLNDFSGALADYNKAISLNPQLAISYVGRGVLKYQKLNDFPGALVDFNQAIALNPNYEVAYNNRGSLKADKLNDPQGALADFNQAIVLNPKYETAYSNRGNLKDERLNDPRGALADFNQAIALEPKFTDAYYNRANLKADKLNDPQGALADYNQAITLDPKFTEAYYNRANLKDNLKDYAGALADYTQAISLEPRDARAYNNRGIVKYQKLNDFQGALTDFNQAITINPKHASAYINRGNLKADKLNDPQGALADFNQAIAINPEIAEAYANRGVIKFNKLNDRTGAIADFRTAARIYRKRGDTQSLQQIIGALRQLGADE
jgi:tetratricopeptide (TPR) repeat protein